MKISNIYIESFGGLKNYRMFFEDGFNLISRKNESGKSTIMAFIKMIFYSKLENDRSSDLNRSVRKKYTPWDGSPMAGTIEFTEKGKRYSLHKIFGKTSGQDSVSIICLDNGESIQLDKDMEVGEYFFGLDQPAFEKSIFITGFAGSITDEEMPDAIARKLSNAMLSMEEDTCYNDVSNNIQKAMQGLLSKSGRKGQIVSLREKKKALEDKLSYTTNLIAEQLDSIKERDAVQEELSTLKRRREIRRLNRRYTNYLNDKEAAQERIKSLNEEARGYEAQVDEAKYNSLKKRSKVCLGLWIFFTCLVLAACVAVYFYPPIAVFFGPYLQLVRMASLVVSGLIFLVFAMIYILARSSQTAEAKRILAVKQATDIDAIKNEITDLESVLENIGIRLNELDEQCAEREEEYIDEYNYLDEDEKLNQMIDDATARLFNVSAKIKTTPYDVEKLKMELVEIDNLIAKKQDRYDALNTAYVKLAETVEDIRSGYGEVLNQRTSKIFSVLTGGKYTELIVSSDLSISVKDAHGVYRQWKYLSSGTIDQAYLALRLAMSEMMCEDGKGGFEEGTPNNSMPVFMDDMLLEYDDEREQYALDYLKEESKNRQIIMFSCKEY